MAELKTAAIFSDHMVLQRDKQIKIFGEGSEGRRVRVQLSGPDGIRKADAPVHNGRFVAVLMPLPAGGPYEMIVTDGQKQIGFSDIMIGEVWLAGGQSNMEYELQNADQGHEAMEQDREPNVRFYYTQKIAYMDEHFFEAEAKTGWECFGDPGTGCWSAVGYFFARKLAKDLGVTVGIIGCNWGGTSASAWMDRESLTEDSELRSYVDEYEEAIKGKSVEQQIAEYDAYEAYHAVWGKKAEECAKIDPMMPWNEILRRCGECQWPGPMCCKNPFRPSGLYECMLMRVCPYTMRGVIWYQGESDDHKPRMYEKLFTKMIRKWREYWDDTELPFLFVQLPMHRYQQDPDFKNWPIIREAQMNVYQMVKNTGIAIITEYSQFHEIHPKKKLPVGERLELQAMYQVYHKIPAEDAFGPLYRSYRICENAPEYCAKAGAGIELSFDYAQGGFEVRDEADRQDGFATQDQSDMQMQDSGAAAPKGFEIAGEDKVFVPAQCIIAGDKMYVYSEEVTSPRYVRYAWTNYMVVNIFGKKNRIPLAPFRTSCYDESTEQEMGKAQIQQVMEL